VRYTYVLVRKDIPTEDALVQSCHACLQAGQSFGQFPGDHLVLLSVKDEEALLKTEEMLAQKGINFEIFWEPDDNMGFTALCTEPLMKESRKLFRKYQCWTF